MALMWFRPAERARRTRMVTPVVLFGSDAQGFFEIRLIDRGLYQAVVLGLDGESEHSTVFHANLDGARKYCETVSAERCTGRPSPAPRKWVGQTPPFLRDELHGLAGRPAWQDRR